MSTYCVQPVIGLSLVVDVNLAIFVKLQTVQIESLSTSDLDLEYSNLVANIWLQDGAYTETVIMLKARSRPFHKSKALAIIKRERKHVRSKCRKAISFSYKLSMMV